MTLCTDPFSSDVFGESGSVSFGGPADFFPAEFTLVSIADIIAFIRLTVVFAGRVFIDIDTRVVCDLHCAIFPFPLVFDGAVALHLSCRLCFFSVCHLAPP